MDYTVIVACGSGKPDIRGMLNTPASYLKDRIHDSAISSVNSTNKV